MSIDASLADDVQTSALPMTASGGTLYQIVQETASGPRFLTTWESVEDAMENARLLNLRTGSPFKTIVWGRERAVQRAPQTVRQGDNLLPSYVLHPAAVKGYPEALPVSAVYRNATQIVFLPDGTSVPAEVAGFSVGPLGELSDALQAALAPFQRLKLHDALKAAKGIARQSRRPIGVHANRRGRRVPVFKIRPTTGVAGLGDFTTQTSVQVVTPTEYALMHRAR